MARATSSHCCERFRPPFALFVFVLDVGIALAFDGIDNVRLFHDDARAVLRFGNFDFDRVRGSLALPRDDDPDDAAVERCLGLGDVAFAGQGQRPGKRAPRDLLDREVAIALRDRASDGQEPFLAAEFEVVEPSTREGAFDHDVIALPVDVDGNRLVALRRCLACLVCQLLDRDPQRVGVVIEKPHSVCPSCGRL